MQTKRVSLKKVINFINFQQVDFLKIDIHKYTKFISDNSIKKIVHSIQQKSNKNKLNLVYLIYIIAKVYTF